MTNTKGTNAEVEERIQYALDLLSQDLANSLVVEKLHEKYKKSYQTHRKDVKEAYKLLVKESDFKKEEFNYIIRRQIEKIDETYQMAKAKDNVAVMAGSNKAGNSWIRNYVAVKREIDYPEMWQNAQDNEAKRQSFGGIDRLEDRLEKKDHLFEAPWDKYCKEQDELSS